jgi:hypothetical protein
MVTGMRSPTQARISRSAALKWATSVRLAKNPSSTTFIAVYMLRPAVPTNSGALSTIARSDRRSLGRRICTWRNIRSVLMAAVSTTGPVYSAMTIQASPRS